MNSTLALMWCNISEILIIWQAIVCWQYFSDLKSLSNQATFFRATWRSHVTNLNLLRNLCGEVFRTHAKFLIMWIPMEKTVFLMWKFTEIWLHHVLCHVTIPFNIWQCAHNNVNQCLAHPPQCKLSAWHFPLLSVIMRANYFPIMITQWGGSYQNKSVPPPNSNALAVLFPVHCDSNGSA